MRRIVKRKNKLKEDVPSVWINSNGYKESSKGLIHRIAYFHYHPKVPKIFHVHHIDCNKMNNELANLIAIPSELHSFVHREILRIGRNLTRAEIEDHLEKFNELQIIINALQAKINELINKRDRIMSKYGNPRLMKASKKCRSLHSRKWPSKLEKN